MEQVLINLSLGFGVDANAIKNFMGHGSAIRKLIIIVWNFTKTVKVIIIN